MQLDVKKQLAQHLAGISSAVQDEISRDLNDYFARVFKPPEEPARNDGSNN
jgi:hypothetical protein